MVAATGVSLTAALRGWAAGAASTRRFERDTRADSSLRALIWSATTRRILALASWVSCGSSTTPRRSSARVASNSRWICPVMPRRSPMVSRNFAVALLSASVISAAACS
jgi:hypothetical protein